MVFKMIGAHPTAKTTRHCAGVTELTDKHIPCATKIEVYGNRKRCYACSDRMYVIRGGRQAKKKVTV